MNFIYGLKKTNPDGSEWWEVHCSSKRVINASSDLACQKIIKLAKWLLGELKEKPLNQSTLEKKANWLVKGMYYRTQECWRYTNYVRAQYWKEHRELKKNKSL